MKKIMNTLSLLVALTASSVVLAGNAADDVKLLHGGYVRSTPPEQKVSAAFFELENKGNQTHTLTGIKTAVSSTVELHRTVTEGKDMMQMKPVKELEIPAHQKLVLQPGGNHVMLMDLSKPLTVGENVKFTLLFEDGSEMPIKLLVKDVRD